LRSVLCKILRHSIIEIRMSSEIDEEFFSLSKIAWSLRRFEVNLTNLKGFKNTGIPRGPFYVSPVARLHSKFPVLFDAEGVAIDVHCYCWDA
jgi:hypothetical protein